ncbi:hypothetical protein TWF281_002752 [Arthrobotrys megalospora]
MDLSLASREAPKRSGAQGSRAGSVHSSASSTASFRTAKSHQSRQERDSSAPTRPRSSTGSRSSSAAPSRSRSATDSRNDPPTPDRGRSTTRSRDDSLIAGRARSVTHSRNDPPVSRRVRSTTGSRDDPPTRGRSSSRASSHSDSAAPSTRKLKAMSRARSTESSVSGRSGSDEKPESQGYRLKTTEVFEAFRMLPNSLQKIEMERKQGLWKKPSFSAAIIKAAAKAKSDARKRLALDFDDEPSRSQDANAANEPGPLAFFEDEYLMLGGKWIPRIDLRSPVIIDPTAPKIHPQPLKYLFLRELAELYHKFTAEEVAREIYNRGGNVTDRMRGIFEKEKADKENPKMVPGSTDPIPFTPNPQGIALSLTAIPQPPFKFLNLIKAAAPEYLPPSAATRPYDWIPNPVDKLSNRETLPALFWSASKKEAVSIVFYLFPTPRNINYPVSVGIVDDKTVPNITVNPIKFMSQSLLKVYWSGYIDFSRPMVVPNSAIHSNSSPANANEKEFWDLWKCLLKKPSFGGHQYGMTTETRGFENPVRLRRMFENTQHCTGEYTAQMALDKPPLLLKQELNSSTDDSDSENTIMGCDLESEIASDDDDSKTVTAGRDQDDEFVPSSDSSILFTDPSSSESEGPIETKPVIKNWLDSIFERPPTITLDPNVKITVPGSPVMEANSKPVQELLKEVQIKEAGINLKGRIFDDPTDYQDMNTGLDTVDDPKTEDLNRFEKGILMLLSQVIGPDGKTHEASSAHIPYRYNFPGVNDTKSFLRTYIRKCVEEAQEAEIKEKGYTELPDGPYMWDDKIHEKRMAREVVTRDVIKAFKKAFGIPPYPDRSIRRSFKMINQAQKNGRKTIPVPWVPREVLDIVDKDNRGEIKASSFSATGGQSDSSSGEEATRTTLEKAQDGDRPQKDLGIQTNAKAEQLSKNSKAQEHTQDTTSECEELEYVFKEPSRRPLTTKRSVKSVGSPPPLPPRPPYLMEMIRKKHLPQAKSETPAEPLKEGELLTEKTAIQRDTEFKGMEKEEADEARREYLSGVYEYPRKIRKGFEILSDAKLDELSAEESDSEPNDDTQENTSSWVACAEDADASWLIARSDEPEYGKRKLLGKLNGTETQAFLQRKGVGAAAPVNLKVLTADDECVSEGSDEDEAAELTEAPSMNPKSLFFIECNASDEENSDPLAPKDEPLPKSSLFIECNEKNGSDNEGTQKPAATDDEQLPKAPLSIEYSSEEDSDEEETTDSAATEAGSIPKSAFFIECNASDESDEEEDIKLTKDEQLLKSSLFIECNASNEEDDEEDVKLTEDEQLLKSSLFIECNANDDSEGEEVPEPTKDDEITKSSLSTERNTEGKAEQPYKATRTADLPPGPSPTDQSSNLPQKDAQRASRAPSDVSFGSGDSRMITRAELRALRKSHTRQIDFGYQEPERSAPVGRLEALKLRLLDTNDLQPHTEIQRLIRKPGKIRIPDVFQVDQAPASGAPTGEALRGKNSNPPGVTHEQFGPGRRLDSAVPATDETEASAATFTSRPIKQRPVIKKTAGESDWSHQMRQEGLRRRFESGRRRPQGSF